MRKILNFFIRPKYTTCPHCGKLTDYYEDTCDNCGRVFK